MVENCYMNCKNCDQKESCDNPEKKVEAFIETAMDDKHNFSA